MARRLLLWLGTMIMAAAIALAALRIGRSLGTAKEDDQWGLLLGMMILPGVAVLWPRGRVLERLARAVASALLWLGFSTAYYDYMDHPWFAGPDPRNCDGPCFGWFSFENELLVEYHLLYAAASMTLGLTVLALAALAISRRKRRNGIGIVDGILGARDGFPRKPAT